jgi:hypothetical protein
MASCEHNRHLLKRIKLRIYGLKEGRLHDRYIMIIGALDGQTPYERLLARKATARVLPKS